MTIICNRHKFQYEVECICKVFFPCTLFGHEYDTNDFDRDDLVITRLKKGGSHTFLLAVLKWNGKVYHAHRVVENNRAEKQHCEEQLCTALYEILTRATGVKVKWGIMTGVRPVKFMIYLMKQGMDAQSIRREFQERYLVSDQKISLMEKTARNQIEILRSSREDSYSLYISIPFCPSRCCYCSFVSSSIAGQKARKLIQPYVDRLCEELRYMAKMADTIGLRLESIYIGGGTPTTLSTEQLKQLTDVVREKLLCGTVREYTIEAGRADTITREKLAVIAGAGATRISINPQTFNDEVLAIIGRKHTAQQVLDCYQMAREMGFEDINMDFIAGLPGDTPESFQHTIQLATELAPTNITVHTLSLKRSSSLYTVDGLDERMKQVKTGEMVDYAYETLSQHGYEPYYLYRQKNTLHNLENVGYCKKGYEGLYNIFIMEERHTILAAGAGGVTKLIRPGHDKVQRIFNYKYPFEYLDGFSEILKRKEAVFTFYGKN